MYESWLLPAVLLAMAPFIGSFIGVLVMRLPELRPVVQGRSMCDHCNEQLGARDLLPVVSWLSNRARCRHCGAKLSTFYPLVEVSAFAVAAWAALITSGWVLAPTVVLGWILLALALIDWRSRLLPDVLTIPLAAAGIAVTWIMRPAALPEHLLGLAGGAMTFIGIAAAYRATRKQEGLGLGDAKLLGALGAWISWSGLPTAVLYAGVIGLSSVLASTFAWRPVTMHDRLPLGTFLALGGWLVWLYGPLTLG